jgi:hypothetical protein
MGPDPDGEAGVAPAAPALPGHYFELYQLAVEMAYRISARRSVANNFFLTVNTGVIAVLGTTDVRWYLAAAGIVLCVAWWELLKSYRDLNAAKFVVILAMEKKLPAQIFTDEWQILHPEHAPFALNREALRAWSGQYRELGYVERLVPWVFVLIYIVEIMRQVIR